MSDNSLLEKLKAEYEQKIAEMELRHKQEIDLMKEQLASMRKPLFSSKSERTKIVLPNPDQLSLFDEAEHEATTESSEEATTVKTYKRKKQRTQKKLDLSKAERNVVVLDLPMLDTRNKYNNDLTARLITSLVIQLFSYVAQTERELNHQRTMEGLAAARARGVRLGRKPMDKPQGYKAVLARWQGKRLSARKAAGLLGVSTPTFLKWTREQAYERL